MPFYAQDQQAAVLLHTMREYGKDGTVERKADCGGG
jgi:hypothetical protein